MMSLTRTDLTLTEHFRASTVETVCRVKTLVSATAISSFEHDSF
jgi:hypothetical protein